MNMPSVRAKFYVNSITESLYSGASHKTVKMSSVTSGSPENAEFFKWTPTGSIEIGTLNPAAAEAFVIGGTYYVDFTPAPGNPLAP